MTSCFVVKLLKQSLYFIRRRKKHVICNKSASRSSPPPPPPPPAPLRCTDGDRASGEGKIHRRRAADLLAVPAATSGKAQMVYLSALMSWRFCERIPGSRPVANRRHRQPRHWQRPRRAAKAAGASRSRRSDDVDARWTRWMRWTLAGRPSVRSSCVRVKAPRTDRDVAAIRKVSYVIAVTRWVNNKHPRRRRCIATNLLIYCRRFFKHSKHLFLWSFWSCV